MITALEGVACEEAVVACREVEPCLAVGASCQHLKSRAVPCQEGVALASCRWEDGPSLGVDRASELDLSWAVACRVLPFRRLYPDRLVLLVPDSSSG